MSSPARHGLLALVLLAAVGACSTRVVSDEPPDAGGGDGGQGTSTATTSGSPADAGNDGASGADAGDDGTPTRIACTSQFGTALNAEHGRMDGLLVSIVPPGSMSACNDDTSHVHLQVQINGAVYDVAVNTDTLYDEIDAPLPGGAWAEGWHPGQALDYPSNLGVHSTAFTTTNPTAIAQMIETELATVNHISIFATGYGATGAHDVHREGKDSDGAIIINPLDATAHLLLFCFNTDSF